MYKDQQNNSETTEVVDDVKKPEQTITAEIENIEVTGDDEPTKYEKRRERWGVIAVFSFIASVGALVYCACGTPSVGGVLALVVCSAVFFFSLGGMIFISPNEPTGKMPWWYGGL